MLAIAYYFFQVVVCSGLMTAYYWLVLRNKRFHQYNRFYLLAITLLAWIVPLVRIRLDHQAVQEDPRVWQLLMLLANNNARIDEGLVQGRSAWEPGIIPLTVYLLVAATLFIFMIRTMVRLYLLLKRHSCRNVGDVYLILTRAQGTPFSFFRYIFWNEEIDIRSEAGKQILQHELTHVQQKHSIDKIFIQLVLIAGWFNPFFWLIRKEMDMIHEFIADRKSVNEGDTAALAQLLLTAAYPQQRFAITNPFFSPVKRRLQMLANTRNPRFSYIRRLVVLPLLAVVTILFAFRNKEQRENATISVATVMENVVNELHPEAGSALQTAASVKGTVVDTIVPMNRTAVNVAPSRYSKLMPAVSIVIVDGIRTDAERLSAMNPSDINSISIYKGAQAIAYGAPMGESVVVVETKKYRAEKGVMEIIIRDTGRLPNRDSGRVTAVNVLAKQSNFTNLTLMPTKIKDSTEDNSPLILIDGVKGSLGDVTPADIVSVDVYKNKQAIERYGNEARNGVVVVTTRKARRDAGNNVMEIKLENVPAGVQIMPGFPGGNISFTRYLSRNLNTDIIQKNGGPPGKYTVIVSMNVAEDGIISNVHAENNPGFGTAAEAVRVISKGPKWNPALSNGKPVSYQHRVPIVFNVPEVK